MKLPFFLTHLFFILLNYGLSFAFNATAYAETPSTFETAFQAGVSQYQSQKYDEARLSFGQALEKNPQSVQALTNLALAQFQLGNKGQAVALLRKAQNLDPQFSTARAALDFILPLLEVNEIPHEIQMWETLRKHFIVPFSMTGFLALTALCLFSTGWLALQYVGKRRRALKENRHLPPFPVVPTFIFLIFIALGSLTVLKAIDHEIPRGTITAAKIPVLSAPAENGAALFEVYPGLEVILGALSQEWVQVTYPGAMTGWIPKSAVLQTSGRSLW